MQSVGLNGAPDSQGGEGGGATHVVGFVFSHHHMRDNMDTGNTALLR